MGKRRIVEKQILYHGSNVIVEHPVVSIGRKDLDFGSGFYLTPLFEQASKWAVRIKMVRRAENSIVNTYEFTLPQDCKVKRLDAYDKEWLDFIVDSRKGKQPWNGYDVIEGGVADDRVIDAVEAYINGCRAHSSTVGLPQAQLPDLYIKPRDCR